MLYTIAVVLLVLWVLGLVSAYTMGGFIHILLLIAVVMVLINLIGGRRSPWRGAFVSQGVGRAACGSHAPEGSPPSIRRTQHANP